MIGSFFERITNEASSELFFVLIGSAILFALQTAYRRAKKFVLRRRIKTELDRYKVRRAAINVVDLANGDPEFEKGHIFTREISAFGTSRSLYIDAPEDIKERLREKEERAGHTDSSFTRFSPATSFDGGSDFSDIAHHTKIKELPRLIETHRRRVGEKFLQEADGLIFNGGKYGVYSLRFTRLGEHEKPGVELDLFRTDYFTHRVFRSIYRELKQVGHPIASADNTNFLTYRPFLTSLGINTVLICDGDKGKNVVLAKRSTRVHTDEPLYHITMNEGVSQTDKDPFGKVDLELCLKRGLKEELGIDEKRLGQRFFDDAIYQHGVRGAFYDFFLERTNFEIGVTSVLELNLDFHRDIAGLIARDKHLETDGFIVLPLDARAIAEFVSKLENPFVPHGLYVLEMVLLRENITLRGAC